MRWLGSNGRRGLVHPASCGHEPREEHTVARTHSPEEQTCDHQMVLERCDLFANGYRLKRNEQHKQERAIARALDGRSQAYLPEEKRVAQARDRAQDRPDEENAECCAKPEVGRSVSDQGEDPHRQSATDAQKQDPTRNARDETTEYALH